MNDDSDRPIPPRGEISPQAAREFDTAQLDLRGVVDPRDLRVDPAQLFLETTQQTRMAIAISDPHGPDSPIVYVNQAFIDLTGYRRDEVLGRNCRFLQGPATDRDAVARLRTGIEERRYTVVDLLNYRKDGTPFWNAVHVGPIFGADGKLEYFYGSQWDITDLVGERDKSAMQALLARELRHRTDNIFSVVGAIINLTSRRENDVGIFVEKLSERLAALAAAHRTTIAADESKEDSADLATLANAVLAPYRNRFEERVQVDGPPVELQPRQVNAVGLALHEFATNAIKYGALSVAQGRVRVSWTNADNRLHITWQESGGPPVESDTPPARGTGTMLVDGMLAGCGGKVSRDYAIGGLNLVIAFE
ncbi:PAS domain-containing protein [Parerythrobacter aurantius]|uniref:PAS domain-containing protein n=1 Tax=Parerythrobacter aurantius TaxID=3127706 RepID=UPI00324F35E2